MDVVVLCLRVVLVMLFIRLIGCWLVDLCCMRLGASDFVSVMCTVCFSDYGFCWFCCSSLMLPGEILARKMAFENFHIIGCIWIRTEVGIVNRCGCCGSIGRRRHPCTHCVLCVPTFWMMYFECVKTFMTRKGAF